MHKVMQCLLVRNYFIIFWLVYLEVVNGVEAVDGRHPAKLETKQQRAVV